MELAVSAFVPDALRMYREGGIALDALKKVSGAEMPERCNRILRGPYIPR